MKWHSFLQLAVIGLLLVQVVYADIIHLDSADSIEATIIQSAAGDTIVLSDGLYQESVFIFNRHVTVASEYILDGDTAHVANTIIEPDTMSQDTQSCFVLFNCIDTVRIVGLTLRNGSGTLWSLENSTAGGAVYSMRSHTVIEQCGIESSFATYGGGIFSYKTAAEPMNSLTLRHSVIRGCQCWSWGGGLYINHSELVVEDTRFTSCSATVSGGGSSALATNSVFTNCQFDSCTGNVGGLELGSGTSSVRGCTFLNNTSTWPSVAGHLSGGQGKYRVAGNYFGPTLSNTVGVRFCCETDDTARFHNNIIENNITIDRPGSLYLAGVAGEVSLNLFRDNTSSYGPQLYCFQGTTVDIFYNEFENNICIDPAYPSVLLTGPNARQRFHDNTITGNSGLTIDYIELSPTIIDARNNWWGDASGPYHPTQNPSGMGDTIISDSVLFIPWLLEPPDTAFADAGSPAPLPTTWALLQPYPNPFNGDLAIDIAGIMPPGFTVRLFNLLGQEVATLWEGPGFGRTLRFHAPSEMASGVYFILASDKLMTLTTKVVLLK